MADPGSIKDGICLLTDERDGSKPNCPALCPIRLSHVYKPVTSDVQGRATTQVRMLMIRAGYPIVARHVNRA